MKKVFSLAMVLALTLALTSVAFAQVPAPGGPFNSAFRVQNLEATQAQCSYVFYNASGGDDYSAGPTPVDPGDSLYVYVPDLTLASGSYSAVVNCDRKIAAVTNFSDADSGASHAGVAEPGMEWYAPGIYDNYYNFYSDIVVQNASGGLADITIEIYAPGSATPVYTETEQDVPNNASASFTQEGLTQLSDNVPYSAKITGTGNVAPIVNIYGRGSADNQLYSYNPFKAGSLTAYAPVIMNDYYGYDTALVIQNIDDSGSDANVKVTYTDGSFDDYVIPQNSAESIYTPGTSLTAGNTLYGATVTSDQDIVVLVNESNSYNRAASYTGFASGSMDVRIPIVEKRYYGYNSSVTCQNVDGAGTMTIEYSGIATTTTSPNIPMGGTHLFYQPTDPALATVAPNYISSAKITPNGGQNIVCVVNQDINEGSGATTVMDQLYSYEGIAP
jgi:hypothetical protein